MKNPLEHTLLEIEALLRDDPEGVEHTRIENRAVSDLVSYIHYRQNWVKNYQVKKVTEAIKQHDPLPKRKERSLDAELLDSAEIILECEG